MKTRDLSCELTVLVGGKPITEYEHNGTIFIEGRKGSDFELEYKNQTRHRVLVIPAVDGKSVLDGKNATPESKGYIVPAWGSVKIPGWTIDGNNVSKFQFQDKDKSYAAATTESSSVQAGVIGVLVFKEEYVAQPKPVEHHHHHHYPQRPIIQPVPVWPSPTPGYPFGPTWYGTAQNIGSADQKLNSVDKSSMRSASNIMGGAGITASVDNVSVAGPSNTISDNGEVTSNMISASDTFEMGTGWGDKAEFRVTETKFNKGEMTAQLVLYYDSRRNLEKRGIQVTRRETRYLSDLPQAFGGIGCTPPPGWKG